MNKLTIEDVVAKFRRPITLNEHGCWLWLGATNQLGYARYGGTLVHGFTCRKVGKVAIDAQDLCHTCPNKNCINPDHIYVGTHQENMNDSNRLAMGPKGQLTTAQINELNEMLKGGLCTKGEIADKFGVSPQWISKFIRGGFKYAKSQ